MRAISRATATYFASSEPASSQRGRAQLGEAVVQRIGRARAHAAQRVGEARGAVAEAGRADRGARLGGERALRGEEGDPLPVVDERLDAVALDAPGERDGGADAGGALGGVGDAGRRALEDQRGDGLGVADGELQRGAAAERVAEPGGALVAERAQQRDEVVDGARHAVAIDGGRCVGTGVTDEVGRDRRVLGRERLGEIAPGSGRAGEAVQQHERRAGARDLDVEAEPVEVDARHQRRISAGPERSRSLPARTP